VPLEAIEIEGFQSFDRLTRVAFDPTMTLLAGRNNVGKSALLRVLRLFREEHAGRRSGFSLTVLWRFLEQERPEPAGADDARLLDWCFRDGSALVEARFIQTQSGEAVVPDQHWCERVRLPLLGATAQGGQPHISFGWDSGPWAKSTFGVDRLRDLVLRRMQSVAFIAPRRVEQGRRFLSPSPALSEDARNLADQLAWLQFNEPLTTHADLMQFLRTAFPDIDMVTIRTGQGSQLEGEPSVI
jgi:hypothetical protein